jgi:hypothetical protein
MKCTYKILLMLLYLIHIKSKDPFIMFANDCKTDLKNINNSVCEFNKIILKFINNLKKKHYLLHNINKKFKFNIILSDCFHKNIINRFGEDRKSNFIKNYLISL